MDDYTQIEIIKQWLDAHTQDVLNYFANNKMKNASQIELVNAMTDINGILCSYAANGVNKIVRVSPTVVSAGLVGLSEDLRRRCENAATEAENAAERVEKLLSNGYMYIGVATPSSTHPVFEDKVFYVARQAGTYTNFGGLSVTEGINFLKFNGTNWSVEQLIAIDNVPTPDSNNLVKSGGVYKDTLSPQQSTYFVKNPNVADYSDVLVSGVSAYSIYKSLLCCRIESKNGYNVNRTYSIGYAEYGELKSDQRRSYRILLKEYNSGNNSWERSSIDVQNFDISPLGTLDSKVYLLSGETSNFKAEFIFDFSCMTYGSSLTLDGGWSGVPKFIMNNKWEGNAYIDEDLKSIHNNIAETNTNVTNLGKTVVLPPMSSYFVKNPNAANYDDVIVSGVSTFELYKSILYAKLVGKRDYNVNRTYSLAYLEYGELKSDNKRSFRIILKEYNSGNSSWERSSVEIQNFDISPIGTLGNAVYRISGENNSFKTEFIIDFSCMTYGESVTLDGGFTGTPKFVMNNKWVDAINIENLNIHSSEDFNCFRKRLHSSADTAFYGKGGSSDVNNYSCFDIFRSILSLKLYNFDEGLYGLRYIARGETETLKYRVILVKYNENNNTWADAFDTENMLALEQEQGNSIIVIDKTVGSKRMIMEIDFNLTPSIGFYASLIGSGAAPTFVIKQECFVAEPTSSIASLIEDLPVSDGSTIQSGYAYIDSTTYNVKVKN